MRNDSVPPRTTCTCVGILTRASPSSGVPAESMPYWIAFLPSNPHTSADVNRTRTAQGTNCTAPGAVEVSAREPLFDGDGAAISKSLSSESSPRQHQLLPRGPPRPTTTVHPPANALGRLERVVLPERSSMRPSHTADCVVCARVGPLTTNALGTLRCSPQLSWLCTPRSIRA
jgi:hypothetical protein